MFIEPGEHCFGTHHTTTQQENIDIKYVFQSYYIKKYIDSFLNTKKVSCSWSISVAGWNIWLTRPVLADVL